MIRLQLLGSIEARDAEGRELRGLLAQPKRLALLAYLAAASPAGHHRRDTLLGMFWPEFDQEHARNALSQAIHFLRRSLGEAAILSRSAEELGLNDQLVWVDVRAFSQALDQGHIDQALELYRGDLLPSFFLSGASAFEEWLEQERAHLRVKAAAAARRLAERHEAHQHLTLAVACARRAVELSDGDERPVRRLIELLDRSGDRAGAVRAYEDFARRLATEFEVEPALETVALIQRLKASPPVSPPLDPLAPSRPSSESPTLRLGKALAGRYKVERQLGMGAMAVVALAHDLRHQRRVAIKILRPELSSAVGSERFLREIDIAASLMHPHILPLHDSGEADGLLYYVMPYVEGESLRSRLLRQGKLPLADALQITREIADALAYAHHRGFLHRDIKPENILLAGGHALLADFGIAQAIGSAASQKAGDRGLCTGTPFYMSPEQISGEGPVDVRTDVYALGCVLFEMLAGQPPFNRASAEEVLTERLNRPAPSVSTLRSEVSSELDEAIARALARVPSERFATVSEFGAGLIPPYSAAAEPLARRPRSGLRRIGTAAVSVAILAIGSLALWRQSSSPEKVATDPRVVAVLPFRVAGADPSLQYLRHGMVDLLVAKLTGEAGPRAADARSVLAAFRTVADTNAIDLPDEVAMKIATRVGARLVLQGSVAGSPEQLMLTAALLDGSGSNPKHATVEGPKDSLFVLVDQLTTELLAMDAGVSPQQLSSLTTTSLDALRAYLEGQAAYRRGAFAVATEFLDRALQVDSTFALAASALVEAQNWTGYARTESPGRLAWKYRARLSQRDQLVLSARLGPRYPRWSPSHLEIAASERVTRLIPESPEAWHNLGDMLFHSGVLGGISDARMRARLAFERAVQLDSLFAPALTHLIGLAAERVDPGEVIRLAPRYLALDSTDWPAFAARWHLAVARRDEKGIADFLDRLRTANATMILNLARGDLADSAGLAHRDTFLALARARIANPRERNSHALLSWIHALNLGRPAEARAWLDSTKQDGQHKYLILGWVFGADTSGIDQAGRREQVLSAQRPGATGWPNAPFLMEAWKLLGNDLSTVDQTIQRLNRDPELRDTIRENHLLGARLLEGWAATLRNSPQAGRLLAAADSMLVGRGDRVSFELLNPLVAHVFTLIGATDRALGAIRRRAYMDTFLQPMGLAETSRLEGLWAAQNGDRAGAIVAYKRYLMLRTDPEPSMIPQRDSVRRELQALGTAAIPVSLLR